MIPALNMNHSYRRNILSLCSFGNRFAHSAQKYTHVFTFTRYIVLSGTNPIYRRPATSCSRLATPATPCYVVARPLPYACHALLRSSMLCYGAAILLLCSVMLCYAPIICATLLLCFATLCYALLRFATLCYALLMILLSFLLNRMN